MSDDRRRAELLRAALDRADPSELGDRTWAEWVTAARGDRVIPQLYALAGAQGGEAAVERFDLVTAMQLDVACTAVRIEHALVSVAHQLIAAEVPFAVLKGCATAHLDYRDPSQRQVGDVDLLVDPEDMSRVRGLLEGAGWHSAYQLPPHHDRFTHAITYRRQGIAEIDLHQHVAHRSLGLLIPTSELLAARMPYQLAGQLLWALADGDRLIHACIHAVASRGGYRRLSSLADVLVMSEKQAGSAREVLHRAEGWRVRSLAEQGIRQAWDAAMLELPDEWRSAMADPIRQRDRLVDRAYLGEKRRPAAEELAHLRYLPTWRDRLLYLSGHVQMGSGPGGGGVIRRLRYLWSRLRQRD